MTNVLQTQYLTCIKCRNAIKKTQKSQKKWKKTKTISFYHVVYSMVLSPHKEYICKINHMLKAKTAIAQNYAKQIERSQ